MSKTVKVVDYCGVSLATAVDYPLISSPHPLLPLYQADPVEREDLPSCLLDESIHPDIRVVALRPVDVPGLPPIRHGARSTLAGDLLHMPPPRLGDGCT